MAKPNYIELHIDGQKADIDPAGQIPTVSYALEDEENFEQKKAAESFDIEMPATLINDQIHNTLHDPSVVDNTAGGVYDNFKQARYVANGQEILLGKYLVRSVVSKNGQPQKYKGKIYGLNGDWVIDLKEKTLADFVNPRTHNFDPAIMINSWSYDGRNEAQDYVYAPIRYRKPFGPYPEATEEEPDPQPADDNVLPNDMKLSISIYWILWRGFKSAGYRIVSTFMDTDYYRRSVLPWVWGGFDYIDSTRWEALRFFAATDGLAALFVGNYDDYPPLFIRDTDPPVAGAFDNSNLFDYLPETSAFKYMMKWQYPATAPLSLGNIRVNLSCQVEYAGLVDFNSDAVWKIHWLKNGIQVAEEVFMSLDAPALAHREESNTKELFFEGDIVPGDWIGARIHLYMNKTFSGQALADIRVEAFQLNFVKLGPNSTIDLRGNYPKLKNYKWLDLLRGEIDSFDLSVQTDPIRKEVYIEPTHGYEINGVQYPGYYNRQQLDYSQKVDLSQEQELELFSDYERELDFKFQEDPNDGGLKKVQDRNQTTIGLARYLLPERYKTEKKERENRFYSPVMHYTHDKFAPITGTAPQLMAIIPENVANTSAAESESTFNPKRAYYKGNVSGVGGWKFNGINYNTLPFLFAVNYKPGGENDPVLSYSDQLISSRIGKGLMKKFFLPRLAILRHGRRYAPIHLMLNNYDIGNFLHRESIIINDIEYVLTSIREYNPVDPDSTACNMWMFVPANDRDKANCFPSIENVLSGTVTGSSEVKYFPHTLLITDIPT